MHLLITPRRHRGQTLTQRLPRDTTVIKGNLVIYNEVCESLHRHSNVARLMNIDSGAQLLPELYDATISAMATEGFTLSGIEVIDQCWFAQSWWCRPVHQRG